MLNPLRVHSGQPDLWRNACFKKRSVTTGAIASIQPVTTDSACVEVQPQAGKPLRRLTAHTATTGNTARFRTPNAYRQPIERLVCGPETRSKVQPNKKR